MPSHATTTPNPARLLVVELWGLGDLALAMPFLQEASRRTRVVLLAQPHAAPLLRRFAPDVEHEPLVAPWIAFRGKYRLHRWPWAELRRVTRRLRERRFDAAVSVRRDPRDHLLLALSGAGRRAGFPRLGSRLLLTDLAAPPADPHRAAHWRSIAGSLGWELPITPPPRQRTGRAVVIHTGAGKPARLWPPERFAEIGGRLASLGWQVTVLDDSLRNLEQLLDQLAAADRFIGNDSGPGHLAALLGVPTFTLFGPSEPAKFSPVHPSARWIEGAPCPHRPCADYCRFARPRCIEGIPVDSAWRQLVRWIESPDNTSA